MSESVIDRMGSDLGIYQFTEEPRLQFKHRVVYSTMACWLKAIALDQPQIGNTDEYLGVSYKRLHERSKIVLDAISRISPEINEWFKVDPPQQPTILLRTRLINCGDLVFTGFNTYVALAKAHSIRLTSELESFFGEIIGNGLYYSGVSSIRNKIEKFTGKIPETALDWLETFVQDALWETAPDIGAWQFFNPSIHTRTNKDAWQNAMPKAVEGIVLARTVINKHSYEYYLLKTERHLTHKLDPFLQKRGYHLRLMHALRAQANNMVGANVNKYDDHVILKLNTRLPVKERILLESYAWPSQSIQDNFSWSMSTAIWNYVKPQIEALGIRFLETKHG